MLPWYWTENADHVDELLYNYDYVNETIENMKRFIEYKKNI